MSTLRPGADGAPLLLVSLAQATEAELRNPAHAALWPAQGLLLRPRSTAGELVELFVATPDDLLAYADLASATLLKPVVLPLQLIEVRPGRINARLATHPTAVVLARTILAALAAPTHPATAPVSSHANRKD